MSGRRAAAAPPSLPLAGTFGQCYHPSTPPPAWGMEDKAIGHTPTACELDLTRKYMSVWPKQFLVIFIWLLVAGNWESSH